ncbi:AAA family ATPase [Rhodospirillaceae bacterium KN72]|uniref:AAA family ATPase n=1 Tax=Pacificispira spongiicola TaxID=2729598 RepID=A0A7Y0HEX2_9PROT|nr:AAA family ATPase [Pacificispira spongiicola]NMM45321.1 AAA family ATPase [Pacificispira spongiicola]
MTGGQDAIFSFLGDPATHGGETPERVDTHAAVVFLLTDRVFKVKRDVAYSFMDFSTREKRRTACLEELRLNRRTAPDLYLGTIPIVRENGELAFGAMDSDPKGTLETAVVMRRFSHTLSEEAVSDADLVDIAEAVARFHDAEPALTDVPGAGSILSVQEGNFSDLDGQDACDRDKLRRLIDLGRTVFHARADLLDQRATEGAIRHCHGDLHLGNICRWEGRPVLFDCIEFDPVLARIDTLYDLAFLLMDLDDHDRRDGANLVLNRYLERRPVDIGGVGLLPLFQSMRAQIRSKVGFAGAGFASGAAAEKKRADADAYLDWALRYLSTPKPCLIAVGGISGSGKSTLARALAPHVGTAPGAVVARSDAIRKRLFNMTRDTDALPPEGYSTQASIDTYAEMARICATALNQGHAAIADATFTHEGSRADIKAVAQSRRLPFVGLWLDIDPEQAVRRVTARKGDVSDADAQVVRDQVRAGWGEMRWHSIDATLPLDAQIAAAQSIVKSIVKSTAKSIIGI